MAAEGVGASAPPQVPSASQEATGSVDRLLAGPLWLWPILATAVVAAVGELVDWPAAAIAATAVVALVLSSIAKSAGSRWASLAAFAATIAVLGFLVARETAKEEERSRHQPARMGSSPVSAEQVAKLRDLRRLPLRGANLSGLDLPGRDLRGVRAEGVVLAGASLVDARLDGADLVGADLRGASLRRACLRGAYLNGARLEGADVTGADRRGALGLTLPRSTLGRRRAPSADACQ